MMGSSLGLFDLRDDADGNYQSYKFPNGISKHMSNNPKAEIAITIIWEMAPHKFMLVCIFCISSTSEVEKFNDNFVYTAKDQTLRPALFSLEKYADLHLD